MEQQASTFGASDGRIEASDSGQQTPGKDNFLNYLAFQAGLFDLDALITSQDVFNEVNAAI